MREEQYQRLKSLSEKLTDVVLDEADPASWPGDGMTTETWRKLEAADAKEAQRIRGDRYWSKKNAAATLSLLTKIYTISGIIERSAPAPAGEGNDQDDDLDKEIRDAEKEATKILKKVQARAYERSSR
jgi:hypothetical protein